MLRLIAQSRGRARGLICPHCKQRVEELVCLGQHDADAPSVPSIARQATYTPAEADTAQGGAIESLFDNSPFAEEAAAARDAWCADEPALDEADIDFDALLEELAVDSEMFGARRREAPTQVSRWPTQSVVAASDSCVYRQL